MIEVGIDPGLHNPFDFAEVDDHTKFVELFAFNGDDRDAVVAVQVATLAGVVEQPMAVTEVNFAGDSVHGNTRSQESEARSQNGEMHQFSCLLTPGFWLL